VTLHGRKHSYGSVGENPRLSKRVTQTFLSELTNREKIEMNAFRHWGLCTLAASLIATLQPSTGLTQPKSSPSKPGRTSTERDGQHDFDWDIGTWKTHQRRLLHPLSGSTTWVEYNGTDVVRKVWDGANTGIVEADGPAGHLEIFTLRLYNPDARQWGISFTNSAEGTLSTPAIGEFKNGRGEFYDEETYKGRFILLRFSVSDITPTSCRFEQAFSDDWGKTWEVNFVATETLVKEDDSHNAQ
jgi:hypothetical protein